MDWLLRNTLDRYLRRFQAYRKWRGLPEPMSPEMARFTKQAMAILMRDIDRAVEKNGFVAPPRGTTIYIRRPARYAK